MSSVVGSGSCLQNQCTDLHYEKSKSSLLTTHASFLMMQVSMFVCFIATSACDLIQCRLIIYLKICLTASLHFLMVLNKATASEFTVASGMLDYGLCSYAYMGSLFWFNLL